MEKHKIGWIDRLQDRGFVDQWGFVLFAFAGSVAIVAAKYLEVSATWVVIGAVAVMLLYAAIIARSGTGRLRSDQAGDNCYYLGLIYTLSSLAYAIFFFDPANTATTIVQGFGIALATTIAGLILRVFFNQGRPDLENVEEIARLELTQAAAQLKTELGQVVLGMNDFSRQVQQAIAETRDAAVNDISNFTGTAIGGLQEVVQTTKDSIKNEATDFASRSKRFSSAADRLVTAIEGHGNSLDRLQETQEAIAETASGLSNSTSQAQTAVAGFATQSEDVAAGMRALREGGEHVHNTAERVSVMLGSIEERVTAFHGELSRQLDEVRAAPGTAIANATRLLGEAAAVVRAELEALQTAHQNVTTEISNQASAALETTKRHNQAMEGELSRSRELLEKVHSNLSGMTAELAAQVEGRR